MNSLTGFLVSAGGLLAAAIPAFTIWGLRTNARHKPHRFVPGFKIGVASWDAWQLRAKTHWEVPGLDEACVRAHAVLVKHYGAKAADRMMDFDVWFYPLNASKLSEATGPRTSGTIHPYYNNLGFKRRRCVRIRDLGRGDIRTTAFAHEIAWHIVLEESDRGWNLVHTIKMGELEKELEDGR